MLGASVMQAVHPRVPCGSTSGHSNCSRFDRGRFGTCRRSRLNASGSYTSTQEWREANPGFDEVQLNEEYYESLGITADELTDQLSFLASDTDPEGYDMSPEQLAQAQTGTASFLLDEDMDTDAWGPKAVTLAGFKAEECAMVRCILDEAGSDSVKVLPCTSDMLYMSLEHGLSEPEVDWSQPRPDSWGIGREWGSQRVILFSGLSGGAVLTVVELLEEAGLPRLCIAVAEETDAQRVLGEMFAEAIKAQRGGKAPKKAVWDVPGHVAQNLPDLGELIGQQAHQRSQELQEKARSQPDNLQSHEAMQTFSAAPSQGQQAEPTLKATPAADANVALQHQTPHATTGLTEPITSHQRHGSAQHEQTPAAPSSVVSPDELQASRHAQAMAPGIDSLLKRRKQQPSPQQASAQQAPSMSTEPAQSQSASAPAQGQLSHQRQSAEAVVHDLDGRATVQEPSLAAVQDAAESSSMFASTGGRMSRRGPELVPDSKPSAEADSLLDAIIAGTADWDGAEAATNQQHASEQQSRQVSSVLSHSSQQAGLAQPQTQLHTPSQALPQAQPEGQPNQQADAQLQDVKPSPSEPAKLQSVVQKASLSQFSGTNPPQNAVEQQSQAHPDGPTHTAQQIPGQAGRPADNVTKPVDTTPRPSSKLRLRTTSPGLQAKSQRLRDAAKRQAQAGRSQAAKLQGPAATPGQASGSTSSSGLSGRGVQKAEPKWRVVRTESTAAEDFVKPPADAAKHRPAWAPTSAAQGGEGSEAVSGRSSDVEDVAQAATESRALTKQELKALADRRGLDFQKLLADARSRGIAVAD